MKALFSTLFRKHAVLLIVLCSLGLQGWSQTFNFIARDANNIRTARQIKAHNGFPDTIVVRHDKWDEMVSNGTSWGSNLKFKSVHDFVKFYVDYGYPVKIQEPWTFKLTYRIYGFNNIADTLNANLTVDDTLTVSYKPDSLAAFQDMQYKKYSGYHKIMIVLTGLYKITGANTVPVVMDLSTAGSFSLFNFNVEGAILQQPYVKQLKVGSSYVPVYTPAMDIGADAASNDYLPVRWNISGMALNTPLKVIPANYELEWTYIDDYKVNPAGGAVTAVSPSALNYNFRENSTRVWLDSNYYQIPLIYQRGYLVYRVRMVRPDSASFQYPVYGPWTLTADNGTVSSVSSGSKYAIAQSHMNDSLNWQYTVSFAEQGKYKHVMSYYDGMLKNRQSITRFNSMPGKLIATEQVYDYEGRPSISLLPTPVTSGSFHYIKNLTLNQATNLPYRALDFDALQLNVCPLDHLPSRLADSSPASQYYSPANPDQAGFQKFVPDAGGYPFVQTIYSPGYDERVEKQGGAGDSLQIGRNHNVKNDYVSSDQMDLDRLFGTDIGWSGFYRKTVSRDPNGQLSLNVTDYHGKTVTSSMIGIPDTVLHAIVPNENVPDTTFYWEDHIAGTAQQIIGNKRILDKNFFNDAGGNNLAQYIYTFTPFPTFCPGKYLSVKARYDYTIFDECGTIDLDTGGTLGTTGVISSPAPVSDSAAPIPFYMEKGKHSLHKELTVNTDDVDEAVDNFMALKPADNCLKTEPWFIRQSVESKEFPCPETYNNMDCDPCAGKKYQMMQELWPNKDSVYMVRKYGVYHRVNDSVIGNGNSIFTPILVTIPSGNPEIPPTIISRHYRYQDTCLVHLPASVTRFGHTYTNLQSLPVDTFIYIFNDSIAEALLPLHPEYCRLLECADDHYKDVLQSIPNATIANQLGMLNLSGMIAHDPLYTQMQGMTAQYPNAYDTLAYTFAGVISLDTMAFLHAYCNCEDSIMFAGCRDSIFAAQINNGELINDYVRERYFETVRNLYIGNRSRYLFNLDPTLAGLGSCATCSNVRMTLVPQPIFPDAFDGNNLATGPGSFLGTAQTIDPSAGATISNYFTLLQTVDQDSFSTYILQNDSALTIYNNNTAVLCQGAVDGIIAQLVNCADSVTLVGVRNTLLNLCSTGQVVNSQFSPAQIRAALVSNGISLGDLCNPYLVNYDNNMALPAGNNPGLFTCNDAGFYADVTSTLNGNALLALKNPGSPYSITFNTANQFEAALKSLLGGVSGATVSATFNSSLHLYTLKFASGGLEAKVFFKTAQSGICNAAFSAASGETISVTADCINNSGLGNFARGYIGAFSFAVTVHHNFSGGTVTHCLLPAWTDKIEMNQLGENPIAGCVPCTQMRSLYTEFQDTLTAYNVKGTGRPTYSIMLRNFMNYRLKKPFALDQYQTFIESCALADSMPILNGDFYGNAYMTFSTAGGDTVFVNAINALDPDVHINPKAWYRYTGLDFSVIALDFKEVPFSKLAKFRDFITNYGGAIYNAQANPYQNGYLLTFGNTFHPGSSPIFNGFVHPFIFAGGNDPMEVWNGSFFVPDSRLYSVIGGLSSNAENSYNTYWLQKYLHDNNIPAIYFPALQHTVNDQYTLPDKQAYLHYTYSNQSKPPGRVLDTLQTVYLEQNLTPFNGQVLSYGCTSVPGDLQHLCYGDDNSMDAGQFWILQHIIDKVNFNVGSLLFSGNNVRNIPTAQITAYRCADTAFWYRYFGDGDTLYDVFIRVPAYIDTNLFQGYTYHSLTFNPGEGDSRSFKLSLYNPNAPIPELVLNGYTDFVVARNKVLKDVLLAHPVNEPVPIADTVNNCERDRLNAAVYEGKIRYQLYIDSVRQKLRSDFFAWIMNNGIQEKLNVGYRNQRFNYTLYYYDRAGNLMRTVPPAGTNPLPTVSLAAVDAARTQNSSGPLPVHTKPSEYTYNTLNQVAEQRTPDGGRTVYFYDAAGRAIFSQNEKQRQTGRMTYTLYDKQGRITETGAAKIACTPYFDPFPSPDVLISYPCSYYVNGIKTPFPPQVQALQSYDHQAIVNYVRSLSREEVVLTHYDTAAINLVAAGTGMSTQDNLRKRVSCIKYFDFLLPADAGFSNYDYAMHFSYDIAGNVKTLTRDYPAWKDIHQQFKRVDYDYDVISGKVNLLSYNRSFADQFFQRYDYDADNRITQVQTSSDGYIWKRDAGYQYYQHGPLARMSLGDLRVQGVDYAYTIQGWLKAVNGDMLDTTKDMGGDAGGTSVHARDAVALTLDYFKGDYRPIGNTAVTHIADLSKNMYNGNIPRATTGILPFPALNTNYVYDQLNRIIKAQYAYVNPYDGTLSNTADYYSKYAYDPDGNLKKLVRNGNAVSGSSQLMDSLEYQYQPGAFNNRLQNVTDYVSNSGFHNDIKHYTNTAASRYLYDNTGNVVKDLVAGQDTIKWNHYNKVTETRNDTVGNGLRFAYDGAGNRYLKTVYRENADTTLERSDYYVRDAQGNILAIYDAEDHYKMTKTQWVEHISDHLMLYSNLNDYLHLVIAPHYMQEGTFRSTVLEELLQNDSYTAAVTAGYPVSFYVAHNDAVKSNILAHTGDYSDFYSSLRSYSQSNNQPVMGSAMFSNITADNKYSIKLIEALMDNGIADEARRRVLQLMCAHTDSLFRQLIKNYGLSYDTTDCNLNAVNLVERFRSEPNLIGQFSKDVDSKFRYNGFSDDYWKFIKELSLDEATLNEPGYTDMAHGGLLIPYLEGALSAYANGTSLGAFLDTWAPARDLLTATGTPPSTLLGIIYDNDAEGMLSGYVTNYAGGSLGTIYHGLTAIPWLRPGNYLSSWNVPMMPDSIIHTVYTDVLQSERISLGSHHLYGSSRLGTKDYLPGEYYTLRDYSGPTPILDTVPLNARRPWYSLEYNDAISALSQQPWNMTDVSAYQIGHQVGQKQYELTNHLGNVQATVSDYPVFRPVGAGDTIRTHDPALVTAYDYYPFGMLMPGRGTDSINAVSTVQGNILVTFNDFSDGTAQGWQPYNGATSVTNPSGALQANMTNTAQGAMKTVSVVSGRQYRARFTVTSSAGTKWITELSGGQIQVQYTNSFVGAFNHDYSFTANGPQATFIIETGIGYTAPSLSIDNFVLEEIKPQPEVPPVTNGGCITMTQSKWVTTYETDCYYVKDWIWPYFTFENLNGGAVTSTVSLLANDVNLQISSQESANFEFDAVPGLRQSVDVELSDITSGAATFTVQEQVSGNWVTLASQRVKVKGTYSLSFTPTTSHIKLKVLGEGGIHWHKVCVTKPVLKQENVLVDICPEDKDRYRFGFNGQEKVNEWSGVGNYLDYDDRGYDSRTARWLSVDPAANKYPGISPYVHTLDNPIKYRDADGREVDVAIDNNTITFSSTIYIYGANSDILVASYQRAFDKFAEAQLTNRTYTDGAKTYNVVFKMVFVPGATEDAERIRNSKNEEIAESIVILDPSIKRGFAKDKAEHTNYGRSLYDGDPGQPATDRASGNGVSWAGTEAALSIVHEIFHNWGLGDRYVEHPPQFYYMVGDKKFPASPGAIPAEGFDRLDIMVNCGDNGGNTFSQTHINNLAGKALSESQRRNSNHFIMGREVDKAKKEDNKPVKEVKINNTIYRSDQ